MVTLFADSRLHKMLFSITVGRLKFHQFSGKIYLGILLVYSFIIEHENVADLEFSSTEVHQKLPNCGPMSSSLNNYHGP